MSECGGAPTALAGMCLFGSRNDLKMRKTDNLRRVLRWSVDCLFHQKQERLRAPETTQFPTIQLPKNQLDFKSLEHVLGRKSLSTFPGQALERDVDAWGLVFRPLPILND